MKKFPAKVYLFDALFIDDQSLVDFSLPDRRKLLVESFQENESLAFSELLFISSEDELTDFFMQAVSDGCEGIMAKSISPSSVYDHLAQSSQDHPLLYATYQNPHRTQL